MHILKGHNMKSSYEIGLELLQNTELNQFLRNKSDQLAKAVNLKKPFALYIVPPIDDFIETTRIMWDVYWDENRSWNHTDFTVCDKTDDILASIKNSIEEVVIAIINKNLVPYTDTVEACKQKIKERIFWAFGEIEL